MSGNPQERYERIALDLTKIIVEQKKHGWRWFEEK